MNFSDIVLVATDVDGVLTDGKIFYGNGCCGKFFSVKDGFAFQLLKAAGLKSAIISGKKTWIIRKRLSDLSVDLLFENVKNKMNVIEQICEKEKISMKNICYIGDDILDIPVLKSVGFSAAPQDAVEEVKSIVKYVTNNKAGQGAFRECVEVILKGQKKWKKTLKEFLQL